MKKYVRKSMLDLAIPKAELNKLDKKYKG